MLKLREAPDLTRPTAESPKTLPEVDSQKVQSLSALLSDILSIRADLARFTKEARTINELKAIVSKLEASIKNISVKEDISELTTDVSDLRDDLKRIELTIKDSDTSDYNDLKTDLARISGQLAAAISVVHRQNTDTALSQQVEDIDMGGHRINNLADPIDDSDATTKKYVDKRERIVYQGGGGGSSNLRGLADVVISAVSDDQVLTYDSSSGKWVNQTPSVTGDMLKATYDPTSVEGDAFDVDNHADGTVNKVYTATEKTKLAGIEAGATVYPSTGEQAFLDADHTKLDGIEASADVTDATNVASAGAVMDADFTAADEIMVGTGVGTHGQVTLAASQILGKKAAGAVANLTAAEVRTIINVADGSTAYTDALAKAASVQSGAITDGVTLAPTHDAVYDVKVTADAAQPASTDDADAVAAVNAAGLTLAAGKSVEYTTPTGSRTASGIIKTKVAGTTLAFGDACYMGTDGKMEKALADDAAVTIPATHLCIAVSIAENASGLFLEQGEVYSTADSWAFDIGLSVYLSAATAGLMTKTMPVKVTGNQVQVLGIAIAADKIYWNSSPLVIEYA